MAVGEVRQETGNAWVREGIRVPEEAFVAV